MSGTIDVVRGAVHVPALVARTYFSGVDAVAVLIDGAVLRILPIHHAAAGGCLLKQRNAAGDRVAAAFDVFESRGLGNWEAFALPARWSAEDAALLVEIPEALIT
ncbi:hypothetical protein E6W36_10955 [Hankyongella ginsenosidimutans]|uniref:Uncharacterized protein n=1 Tax=Hankyongella ginsenosidimutans TaxID=1763828 RepID=A0A4D7C8N6_9SPHN|nr:hypothetical protein [Hankyongella ginsenosidimutans]QCI79838.1 hypothetical protein E6W36_10955 [Hankyongella ginsenosidimutans]